MVALNNIAETKFDFNKIIPEPEGLALDCDEITCAMCKQPYLKELYKKNGTLKYPHDHYCEDCDVSDNIGGRLHTSDIDKSDLTKNEKKLAKQWVKEYGTYSWYDWNTAHWNTKWNVNPGDVDISIKPSPWNKGWTKGSVGELTANFVTAWNSPTQILMKLALDHKVKILVHVGGEVDEEHTDVYDGITKKCYFGKENPIPLNYELIARLTSDWSNYIKKSRVDRHE